MPSEVNAAPTGAPLPGCKSGRPTAWRMPGSRATASSCLTASPSTQDWGEAMMRTEAGGGFRGASVPAVLMRPVDAPCPVGLTPPGGKAPESCRRGACSPGGLLVVRLALEDGERAVELLHEHHARQPMGQRHLRQGQREVRRAPHAFVQPLVTTDDEEQVLGARLCLAHVAAQLHRVEQRAALVQRDDPVLRLAL